MRELLLNRALLPSKSAEVPPQPASIEFTNVSNTLSDLPTR